MAEHAATASDELCTTVAPPPAEPAKAPEPTSSAGEAGSETDTKPSGVKEEPSSSNATPVDAIGCAPPSAPLPAPSTSSPPNHSPAATDSLSAQDSTPASQESPKPPVRGKQPTVWIPEVKEAFWQAVDLVPNIGRSRYVVRGTSMDRSDMIAEYIRRQVGHRRTAQRVRSFYSNMKYGQDKDSEIDKRLAGSYIDSSVAASMDWNAFLGPDLYPSTPAAETSHAKPPQKRKRDSSPASTSSVAAEKRVPPRLRQPQQATQTPHPTKPAAPMQPRVDFCPSLRAFFASVMLDRDLGLVADHFVSAGISSIDNLANLLLMDDGSVEGFIERMPKLGAVERAFLRKAVFAARASVELLS